MFTVEEIFTTPPSSSSSQSSSSTSTNKHGYTNPTCSPYQSAWQLAQPIIDSITAGHTRNQYCLAQNISDKDRDTKDLSIIRPTDFEMLPSYPSIPDIRDYVQLMLHIWAPEWFYPHLVSWMPCPGTMIDQKGNHIPCTCSTSRRRWRQNGPRVVHGVHSASYLLTCDYTCSMHGDFRGTNPITIQRLNPIVRRKFKYVFVDRSIVTNELHDMIADCRLNGMSFTALHKQLTRNRYNLLYQSIGSYHEHCHEHIQQVSARNKLTGVKDVKIEFDVFAPILTNEFGYHDHDAPSVEVISKFYTSGCNKKSDFWTIHGQQNTSVEVVMDANVKIGTKLHLSDFIKLLSLMDNRTGVILHQQMIKHESHKDIAPIISQYVSRSVELGKPLPTRVCTDRPLMDSVLLNSPGAFHHAHLTTDLFHFLRLLYKTLDSSHSSYKKVKRFLSRAMYVKGKVVNGKRKRHHANPQTIVKNVAAVFKKYPIGTSCITNSTVSWWNDQLPAIEKYRVISNPANTKPEEFSTISTGRLEGMHSHLLRYTRYIKFTEETLNPFLMQFMFRWNIDRKCDAELAHDWRTYDLELVMLCYEGARLLHGQDTADDVWHGGLSFKKLVTREHFCLSKPTPVSPPIDQLLSLPFSNELVKSVWAHHSLNTNIISTNSITFSPLPPATASSSEFLSCLAPVNVDDDVTILSAGELNVLLSLSSVDRICRKALKLRDWNTSVYRWNQLVESTVDVDDRIPLHLLTSESIESSWQVVLDWQKQTRKPEISSLQPTDYHLVGIKDAKFNKTEVKTLNSLVNQFKSSSSSQIDIDWSIIASRWSLIWLDTKDNISVEHILPRPQAVLKSKYDSIHRANKKANLSNNLNASVNINIANSSVIIDSTLISQSSVNGTRSSIDSMNNDVLVSDVTDAVVDPCADTNITSSGVSTFSIFSSVDTNTTTQVISKPKATGKWGAGATRKFEELYDRNPKIRYQQFAHIWSTTVFDYVDQGRFDRKKQIVRLARLRLVATEDTTETTTAQTATLAQQQETET